LRESPAISVNDADQPPNDAFDVYHFSDARVYLKGAFRRIERGRNGSITYWVAPLGPPDWKRGDRITAWVGHSGEDLYAPASWQEELGGRYRLGLDNTFEEMIREAVKADRVKASQTSPILEWSRDPRADYRQQGIIELCIFGAIGLVGLAAVF